MKPKFMKMQNGKLVRSERTKFEGGTFNAIFTIPKSLLDRDSYYCKILAVLAQCNGPLSASAINRIYNEKYKENKSQQTLTSRLSCLFVYGIVLHFDDPKNKRAGFWSLKEGIDVNDNQALFAIAQENSKKLRCLVDGSEAPE